MPIHESRWARSSELTQKQQQEAVEAIYGLPGKPDTMHPPNDEPSYEERQKWRAYLDQLDRKEATVKEFDLNKPPVEPYVYREYPKMMFEHATGKTRIARNHEEREFLLTRGWSDQPIAIESPPVLVPMTVEEEMEIEEIDRKLEKKKKS